MHTQRLTPKPEAKPLSHPLAAGCFLGPEFKEKALSLGSFLLFLTL